MRCKITQKAIHFIVKPKARIFCSSSHFFDFSLRRKKISSPLILIYIIVKILERAQMSPMVNGFEEHRGRKYKMVLALITPCVCKTKLFRSLPQLSLSHRSLNQTLKFLDRKIAAENFLTMVFTN